jgi:hypothetical protein
MPVRKAPAGLSANPAAPALKASMTLGGLGGVPFGTSMTTFPWIANGASRPQLKIFQIMGFQLYHWAAHNFGLP